MKKIDVSHLGLCPLTKEESIEMIGGDTGYYGKGPDLQLAADRITSAVHNVADFFRGFWDGVVK